jgi:hypothetical protein
VPLLFLLSIEFIQRGKATTKHFLTPLLRKFLLFLQTQYTSGMEGDCLKRLVHSKAETSFLPFEGLPVLHRNSFDITRTTPENTFVTSVASTIGSNNTGFVETSTVGARGHLDAL